jgi:hypothetical protein
VVPTIWLCIGTPECLVSESEKSVASIAQYVSATRFELRATS